MSSIAGGLEDLRGEAIGNSIRPIRRVYSVVFLSTKKSNRQPALETETLRLHIAGQFLLMRLNFPYQNVIINVDYGVLPGVLNGEPPFMYSGSFKVCTKKREFDAF